MMKNVFAHYFTWFARKDFSGRWEHWKWDGPGVCHDPDRIVEGHEDVAAIDIPLIGAYDTGDPKVHRYHLDLALAAGIDAFCVDWYGPPDANNRERDNIVDTNFGMMLKSASVHQVKLCICYEEKILFGKNSAAEVIALGRDHLKYISEKYFNSPGYWRVNGRPVLIIWGNNRLSTEEWHEILGELKEHNPWIIYSHHDHNPQYVDICHGFYPWVLLGDLQFQKAYLEDYYKTAQKYLAEGRSMTLGGGVWPGFDDSGVFGWGQGTRRIENKDDRLYDLTWGYVLENNPAWVSITTWNDWNEGTNIEPGVKKGSGYLKRTADYIARYKGCQSTIAIENVIQRYG